MPVSTGCRLENIHKAFGSTAALAGVDLALAPGEVHALVGENGAGKSTLMKVLSGAVRPDQGTITLDDLPFRPRGPEEARRAGVVMVHQELALAPHLSVEANITLGQESARFGFLRPRENQKRVRAILAQLEHPEIDLEAPVGDLSPAAQQIVEIARALLGPVRVLVLDEPTSTLTRDDVERLFALVRKLRSQGICIVYISHFLEEIDAVADRVTILRDGRTVASRLRGDMSRQETIEKMVGRSLAEQYPPRQTSLGEVLLRIDELAGTPLPRACSLELHRGEILGIAGIVGAGRTELLRTIFGLEPVRTGTIRIRQVTSSVGGPRRRIAEGLGFLSEDRKNEGLVLAQSIADNLTYSRLQPYSKLGLFQKRMRQRVVAKSLEKIARPLSRTRSAHRGPERRQSTKGGPRTPFAPGRRHLPSRRADARHRHRQQNGDLSSLESTCE